MMVIDQKLLEGGLVGAPTPTPLPMPCHVRESLWGCELSFLQLPNSDKSDSDKADLSEFGNCKKPSQAPEPHETHSEGFGWGRGVLQVEAILG
jgi:hypothetical protein